MTYITCVNQEKVSKSSVKKGYYNISTVLIRTPSNLSKYQQSYTNFSHHDAAGRVWEGCGHSSLFISPPTVHTWRWAACVWTSEGKGGEGKEEWGKEGDGIQKT